MYCRGERARSRPSMWCWLKVAMRTLGLRVTTPAEASKPPAISPSSVDLPMPGPPPARPRVREGEVDWSRGGWVGGWAWDLRFRVEGLRGGLGWLGLLQVLANLRT